MVMAAVIMFATKCAWRESRFTSVLKAIRQDKPVRVFIFILVDQIDK